MKTMMKVIALVAFITISCGAFAQTQSKASIEVGYLPESATQIVKPANSSDDFSQLFYANLEVYLSILRYGYVVGEVDTAMGTWKSTGDNFFPYYGVPILVTYKAGAGVVVGGLTVGITHECTHPETPNWTTVLYGNAGYTKVFVNYTVKF